MRGTCKSFWMGGMRVRSNDGNGWPDGGSSGHVCCGENIVD